MITLSDIKRVAKEIGIAANAEQVILFGSHARGEAHAESDVDLLIIADSHEPRFKRARKLYKLFSPYPFGMDLLVYTPEEVEAGKQIPLSFVSSILHEGMVVYDRRT
ncbi:MAG: nucleotidyltransferase domain-containing protein [Caldilineae bacterium]|nr:MAG: nucleotidyltransferase domain-containing protein [Caldilineae bacterium]